MSGASMLATERRPSRGSDLTPAQLERMFVEQHPLIWRTLRRLGLSPAEAAEATREVFSEAAKGLGSVRRHDERSRLLALAMRQAFRSERVSTSEVRLRPPLPPPGDAPPEERESAACVSVMDRVLLHMARPSATAFILFELEGVPLGEVASVMAIDPDVAMQTLMHAREEFKSIVAALGEVARP